MTHRANTDIEAPPAHHASHETMTSKSSDNNEHALHSDSSPPTTLSSKTKGKKNTAHHHAHHLHSSHKKHRSSADMELSPSTLETSPAYESNTVSIDDVPASSTKKTKGHHHHKHHHASHKKKHGTPEDANIVSPGVPQATSPVEPNVVSEDQVLAADPPYDVESPAPIETACLTANKDTPIATQVKEELPSKIHDAPIAMNTKKVHPTPNNSAACESQQDNHSPRGTETNCMSTLSIFLGIISLFCFGIILGVLAIVCAQYAFGHLKREPHRFNVKVTRCKATTGMILGMAGILIWLIILLVFISG